ncbi:MAG: hypothetical protein H3C43_00345 [Leptonema sp. (in: Bacteria)]|nr:hypothetical protein [Leptonema sp. (in: bacteria)]
MTILVLTGIKEELTTLLSRYSFVFEKDLRVYRSLSVPGLYAATTGPGMRKVAPIKKILESLLPEIIINAGIVGILDERDSAKSGDRLKLGQVVKSQNGTIFPGGPGSDILVTVDRPVHDILDKIDLAERFRARACDMEASRIIELVGSIKALSYRSVIHFIKIAGDRPEEAALYEYEYRLWNWQHKSFFEKLKIAIRFPGGPKSFYQLKRSKAKALQNLGSEIFNTIQSIRKASGIPNSLGSIFIPH